MVGIETVPQSTDIKNYTLQQLEDALADIISKLTTSTSTEADKTAANEELKKIKIYIDHIKQSENSTEQQTNETISNMENDISRTTTAISAREEEITEKIQRTKLQEREIEDKKKLIETRNRMLQISQEKNIYKKKIIYTLISIIIAISLIIITGYTFFNRMT